MVKVLAGNKCECSATQRMVDKERGEKVNYLNLKKCILIRSFVFFNSENGI